MILAVAIALVLAACGDVDSAGDNTSTAAPTTTRATATGSTIQPEPTSSTMPPAGTVPEEVPPEETTLPEDAVETGAIPSEMMDKILSDAAERSGVPKDDLVPVRAEQALWNDGSLGCPRPGDSYTQALVPGYWVILRAGEQILDYHAAETGYFVFCENAFPGSGQNPTG